MECHICGVTIGKGCNHYNSVRDNLNAVKESIKSHEHFVNGFFQYEIVQNSEKRDVLTIESPVFYTDGIDVILLVCNAMNCTFYFTWTPDAIQCRIIDMRI
jgi:hypothetical protein